MHCRKISKVLPLLRTYVLRIEISRCKIKNSAKTQRQNEER